MGEVELYPVELPHDELELKWSELVKKLLEIDDQLRIKDLEVTGEKAA